MSKEAFLLSAVSYFMDRTSLLCCLARVCRMTVDCERPFDASRGGNRKGGSAECCNCEARLSDQYACIH